MIDLVTAENFLRRFMREFYPEEASEIRIDTFSRGEDIISAFEPGMYDLLVLDIYMEAVSGMQVAEVIRGKDQNVSIIFLTGSEDYMLEGYRVFADGYIIKPIGQHQEEFQQTFQHIFPKLIERYKELTVQMGTISFSVPYRNIRYVDIDQHQVHIHLIHQDISVTTPYEEVCETLLEDARFLECYHRVIVNMDAIASMGKEEFVLSDGGEKIPISKRKQKEAKARYMHYLVHR